MTERSPLSPVSPQAAAIAHLFWIVIAIMAGILTLVSFLVIYVAIRYRGRPGGGEPRQVFGHRGLEIFWTAGSLAIVAVIFIFTVQAMQASDATPPTGRRPDLEIIAHQWWWEARYPATGVVTANEIHIPVGRPLLVRLTSVDVIHDWWVPALGRKTDAIPGHPNHFWMQADQPGVYLGSCAEYCGPGHAWMRIRVVAQSPAAFAAWSAHERLAAAPPPPGSVAAQGAHLFRTLTCVNCHTIDGMPGQIRHPDIGPDLTHVGSRATLGSGRLTNTPANLRRWLHNPQALKPGVHMPNLGLSSHQLDALTTYLETLK